MKLYLKTIAVILAAFLNVNISWAQTIQIPISDYSSIVRYYDEFLEDYFYNQPAYWDVGRYDGWEGEDTVEDTYRKFFKFNLSVIPANATITNATLKIKIIGECTSCQGTVVFLPYNLSGFAKERWNAIGQSETIYFQNISYGELEELSGQDFTDDIISSLSESHINIGVRGPETYNRTNGIVETMDLFVDYTLPPQNYDITIENSFQGGKVKVDGNPNIQSGTTFPWGVNTQHTIEAFDQDWPEPNNYFRVFQDEWKKNGEIYSTNNPITITVTGEATYRAEFKKRFDFEVTYLEFLNGGSGGNILVNGQPATMPSLTHVIEGDNIQIEVPPQTQTVNGKQVTYNFLKWSDGNTSNPRTFTPTDHTLINATMKGHLASNTSDALTLNNQRKMVWDDTFDKYHMVYEDGGEIYYTSSTGPDNAWVPEVLLSDGGGWNKYPSIDVTANGIVIVVWQREFEYTGDIQMRYKTASGWQNAQAVTLFFASSGFKATPVLAVQPVNYYFIIWHDYDTNNLRIVSYNPTSGTFGTETSIPSTNSSSLYPSLAADTYGKLHLAWSESGSIYYTKINHYHGGNYTFSPSKENISNGTGYYSQHIYPSISTDYSRRANITWQAYNGPLLSQSILHRRRELSDSWSSTTAFDPDESKEYYKPNIMSFPNLDQKLRIAWRRNDNKIWLAKYNGESWNDFSQTFNGFDPNLSANMSADEVAKMVYRGTSSGPYVLASTSSDLIDTEQFLITSLAQAARRRCGVLTLRKSAIAFELGEFKINGNPVNLFPYPDTLIAGNSGKWDEMFRTESFQVSGQSSLSYFRGFTVEKRDTLKNILPKGVKIEFKLELVNAQSGQVISIPDIQTITSNVPPNSREFKDVLFNLAGTQEVFMRVGLRLPKGIAMKQSMVEVYCIGDSLANFQKPLSEETTAPIINKPLHFKLGNNYPNPFNPTTTIAFDLARDSFVELEIYDISGRKVKTMVSKNMEAGSYHAIWDGYDEFGNQVASGVYFYRIQASEFTAVNKMMLLR